MTNFEIAAAAVFAFLIGLWLFLVSMRRWHGMTDIDDLSMHKGLVGAATLTAIVLLGMVGVLVFTPQPPLAERDVFIGVAFVSLLSGLVGFTEIAQRYQDRPVHLITDSPALLYIYLNIASGIGAYGLVLAFKLFNNTAHGEVYQVLFASFGAVTFFRSSFFTARVNGVDVDIGPATLLKGLLTLTDQSINRWQGAARADLAAKLMKDIAFSKAKGSLTALCLTTMQYITKEQQADVATAIQQLEARSKQEEELSILLGAYLIQLVGPEVVKQSVRALGSTIKSTPVPDPLQ
ncbi:hypothetical protein ACELLULO517_05900 [Acidisoma cellulosilytica]|uniref:Uncharacterized protein n=1 Tax=Acidisoma cellulosilyticum TaxID=2802395 RepID=A0A963YZI9_9PROT|nr:hypothetical protein [Acidisoma cellulosilyticum]MCB8879759.1 hypothetical protein [Acidisoma cellulosilyticum]